MDEIKLSSRPKRVRVHCANCKCINYPKRKDIDLDEIVYLCSHCDAAYIVWSNRRVNGDLYVDDFLKTYAARVARQSK